MLRMGKNISCEEAIASVLEMIEAGGVRTARLPEAVGEIPLGVSRIPAGAPGAWPDA